MDCGQPDLETLLGEAEAFHGHLCGGIVIGVRMALAGLREIGIQDPKGEDRKHLMVFVEIDRCATDAITSVTGCRPGKRTMKLKDHGKMAATFVNLATGRAVRVAARTRPRLADPQAEMQVLKVLPEAELFLVQEGQVPLVPGDLPGTPVRSVCCDRCGETVLDMRDVTVGGRILCRACAEGKGYFIPSTGALS
ncbi:MAG TPA: FmdE family protein [Holophaga sp.]|nr:FmdE family protein [Holophaga sp.]